MEIDEIATSYNAFTYHDCTTNLFELAACKLVLTLLWDSLQDPSDHYEQIFKKQVDQVLDSFKEKISDSVTDIITLYHRRVYKSTSIWISYHKERVFNDTDVELIIGMCLPELVWRQDGYIDGLKSAEALVNSAMLSDEQEYRMVCLYCMEKRIEGTWLRLADCNCLLLDTTFDDEVSMISYWNARMANRHCNFGSANSIKCAENRLICHEAADNFTSAGYFFDRLDMHERVSKGCRLISAVKSDQRAEYVKTLLAMYSDDQLRQAFRSHCSDIMYPLIMNRRYNQCALQVWSLVADSVTIQSFLSLMTRITTTINVSTVNSNKRFDSEIDTYEDFQKRIFTLVEELWRLSPESLRRHDLISSTRGVIYSLTKSYVQLTSQVDFNNGTFLPTILSDASSQLRTYVMRSIGSRLAPKCRPLVMDELMNICFADDIERRMFQNKIIKKSNLSNFEKFRDRKFVELQEFFDVYVSPDSDESVDLKRAILKFAESKKNLFASKDELSNEEVLFARRFISDAFAGEDNKADKFKLKFQEQYPRLWEVPQVAEEQLEMEVDT